MHCLQAVFPFKPPQRIEARTHLQLGSVLYHHTKNSEQARSHLEKAVSADRVARAVARAPNGPGLMAATRESGDRGAAPRGPGRVFRASSRASQPPTSEGARGRLPAPYFTSLVTDQGPRTRAEDSESCLFSGAAGSSNSLGSQEDVPSWRL